MCMLTDQIYLLLIYQNNFSACSQDVIVYYMCLFGVFELIISNWLFSSSNIQSVSRLACQICSPVLSGWSSSIPSIPLSVCCRYKVQIEVNPHFIYLRYWNTLYMYVFFWVCVFNRFICSTIHPALKEGSGMDPWRRFVYSSFLRTD